MWKDQIKREWDKNPLMVITVTAFATNAAARLLNAWSASKGRRAYARQVNWRTRH